MTAINEQDIHEFSIDIQLALGGSPVANAHRATLPIPIQVIQVDFGHLMATTNGIYRLEFTTFM